MATTQAIGDTYHVENAPNSYAEGGVLWSVVQRHANGSRGSSEPKKSEAEARAALAEIEALPQCRECGAPQRLNFLEPWRSELVAYGLCFSCNHWRGYVTKRDDPASVRIQGEHYWIGNEPQKGTYRPALGFGGSEFTIRFTDGRIVVTHNLWFQGQIPAYYRDRLPDNAVFEKRARQRYGFVNEDSDYRG